MLQPPRCRHCFLLFQLLNSGDATYQSFGDVPIVSASRRTGASDVARREFERFARSRPTPAFDFRAGFSSVILVVASAAAGGGPRLLARSTGGPARRRRT